MMGKLPHLLFTALAVLLVSQLGLSQTNFTARLNGHQEVQPVATSGTGSVTATLDGDQLIVTGAFSNLSSPFDATVAGGAHIHLGYAGENGGIVFPITVDTDPDLLGGTIEAADNTFGLTQGEIDQLERRQLYVNIHTEQFQGGEIRGQLLPADKEYFSATLLGSNEVPAVMTQASGAVILELDGNELVVTGSFDDLQGDFASQIQGGAHLHLGLAGTNGGITQNLAVSLDADNFGGIFTAANNTYTLSNEQVTALRAREIYVNIHSEFSLSGELRGQVTALADAVFRAHLSGSNEYPAVTSTGTGQVLGEVIGDSLIVSGTFGSLQSPVNINILGGAHLHAGYAGQNGPVEIQLVPAFDGDTLGGSFAASVNRFLLTPAQKSLLLDRGVYLNIHTFDFGAGEIRGQMLNESQAAFTAYLSGSNEVPDVTTRAHGMVKVELSGNLIVASGSFNEMSSALAANILGGAHLHAGYPGQNGPVVLVLASTTEGDSTSGVFSASENIFADTAGTLADTLMDRFFYVNVHSINQPAGEIRGSVLAEATSYFNIPLSGASEPNPPVNTAGGGMAAVELVDTTAVIVGSFSGLESDFAFDIAGGAHIHSNYAGSNGGIQVFLNTEIDGDNRGGIMLADSNRYALRPTLVDSLKARNLYVNIHTTDQPGGEIRGQLLPLATSYFHASLLPINEVPPVINDTAFGGLKLELNDTTLTVTGSFNDLQSDFNTDIGAHLHLAAAGRNGDVVFVLNTNLSDDLRNGVYLADSNRFELTSDQIDALFNGRYYANIHSVDNPAGAVRGQLTSEANTFPETSMILAPADNAAITLAGLPTEPFTATYAGSMDMDSDSIAYIWQLAADANFETVLFAANTGQDTFFTTDFGTVDLLLESASVAVGATVTLYHRVLVSDGSNNTASEGAAVVITRGVVTNLEDFQPRGFEAALYPTIVRTGQVQIEVQSEEAFSSEVLIINQLGAVVSRRKLRFTPGNQIEQLPVGNLPSGTYFLSMQRDGQWIFTDRFIIN